MNNRYNDKKGRYEIKTTTIETLDQAVFDYFDKKLSIRVDTEDGRKKVQIIYATGERWKLIRKNNFRDENGTLILPLISIRRSDIDRTPGFGGMAQETPEITISSVVHPKTSVFQNALEARRDKGFFSASPKDKVVREYLTLPFPDFATVHYEISIWTQYQTQMNEILERIWYAYEHMDSFVMPVEYDGNKAKGNSYYFVGFREGNVTPQENTQDFTDQERILKYVYNIKTPGYFMMDPKDEALAYGREEGRHPGSDGKKVVHKSQNSIDVELKEQTLSIEEFKKLFG
jgi:hypothetical protein